MILTLSGFMGSGKTSSGRELASRLGWQFVDLDAAIEESEGVAISTIFAVRGEAAFRQMEHDSLETILTDAASGNLVLALGGGTLMTPSCRTLIREKAVNIYLRAQKETLLKNLSKEDSAKRPMLGGDSLAGRIGSLMSERAAIYEEAADYIADMDGLSPGEVAGDIIQMLGKDICL